MEEILGAFGVDWRLVVIQIFNFTILIGLLWYFLYTPILNLLNERQQKIEKGVKDADEASKNLESANEEKKHILTAANTEASDIVSRAKTQAEEKALVITKEAQEKAARELESAKEKAEVAKAQTIKESDAEIAKAAVLAAEKVLNEKLG